MMMMMMTTEKENTSRIIYGKMKQHWIYCERPTIVPAHSTETGLSRITNIIELT